MENKLFYFIKRCGNILTIHSVDFKSGSLPILWSNGGLLGLLSKTQVTNKLQVVKDMEKNPSAINKVKTADVFHWDEVKFIDPPIGKVTVI